jgi:hypothetical protein
MPTQSQAIQVTFQAVPVQGQPARIILNGQPATTSTVIQVQTHPQYLGWYWIDTQSGSRYGGQLQRVEASENPSSLGQWVTNFDKTDAAFGCFGFWGASGILFCVGLLLCCTGIGIIVGAPMILGAIILPFLGPALGIKRRLRASCPHCGLLLDITIAQVKQGYADCCGCQQRFLISGTELHKPNKLT